MGAYHWPVWKDRCLYKAFANKLAIKKRWHHTFALRAIQEYKRFVYLGIVSDFIVTPSAVIDKVWHQHVLFSKAYRKFCNEVIRYEFDHNPELVNTGDQTAVFNAQYLDTLKLYKKEFGIEPPEAIWGKPKFDGKVAEPPYRSHQKAVLADASIFTFSDVPLHESVTIDNSFSGFQSGDGGGGGADGSWGSSAADGGSDSSCSSCSSGCGGGD